MAEERCVTLIHTVAGLAPVFNSLARDVLHVACSTLRGRYAAC